VVAVTLLDDLANVKPKKALCAVAEIIKTLKPEEAKALNKALDDPELSPTNLAKILTQNGYNISRQTINRHRNRTTSAEGCKCP
jgi:DNA-directed RNA polymerase specialized sigma54-like protein